MNAEIKALINKLFSQEVLASSSYQVPNSDGMIKLDAMESPYNFTNEILEKLANEFNFVSLNRYPNSKSSDALKSVRDWMRVPENLQIMAGNGSDELISILIMPFIGSKFSVAAPDPSFSMFKIMADRYKVKYIPMPLDEKKDINIELWLDLISRNNSGLIFIPQPNNPTGNLFDFDKLVTLIKNTRALVVLDEAYTAFCPSDLLFLAQDLPNVLIMRTLSKIGLAGIRFGILIGNPEWVVQLDKYRLPYNVNTVTQMIVQFAHIHCGRMIENYAKKIIVEREDLSLKIRSLGFSVWPSQTNFLIVEAPEGRAESLFLFLKNNKILVKLMHGSHPLLVNSIRITVGKPTENECLIRVLSQF